MSAPMRPRAAFLSDLHLEFGDLILAECEKCGGRFLSKGVRDFQGCGCGQSYVDQSYGGMVRAGGYIRYLPSPLRVTPEEADFVVLTGDIHVGAAGVRWAAATYEGLPVFYVPGNHEAYGSDLNEVLRLMREAAAETPNVRILERDVATLEVRGYTVRIVGATLWTNYELNGSDEESKEEAMNAAAFMMNDHRRITVAGRTFTPADALQLHQDTCAWLEERLAEETGADFTILAVHHGVARPSVAKQYEGDDLSPAFVSDLAAMIHRLRPDVVAHGHTHHPVDYRIGDTRVVSAQKGYPGELGDFAPLIIELEARPS